MKRVIPDSRDGIPVFPWCDTSKRRAGLRNDRAALTQSDLWTIGCYLEAGYRRELATFGVRKDMNRLLRKLAYMHKHYQPNARLEADRRSEADER